MKKGPLLLTALMTTFITTFMMAFITTFITTLALPVSAHHSNAMFDQDRVLELSGTVKEFQFTNPHTWIQVMVTDDNGATTEWSLEWGSPNNLGRQGIRPSTFPPGSELKVRSYPMKDGSPGGLFIGARFDDGKTVGNWE